MFIHYRTKGVILDKKDRGEADQLFTVYTKDFGKLEILGRAIRKINSKLRAGTAVFYLSDIEFIQGKAFKTLTDATLIEKFDNLKKDLRKLKTAHQISEVFNGLVKGQEKDDDLWKLLNETIAELNNVQPVISNLQLLFYYFLWNLVSILGYQPDFYYCSLCQKKLTPEKLYFNPKEGGIICNQCFRKFKDGKEISLNTIKILRILVKKDWKTLNRLKIQPEDLALLRIISNYFLSFLKKSVAE